MAKNSISLKACLLLCMIGGGLHAQDWKTDSAFSKKARPTAGEGKIIEVTDELPCDSAATVFIGNIIRRVTVRTTHENKVRLVTTVAYKGKSGYTNEEWLEKLELKVSGTAGFVNVKCGNMQPMDNNDVKSLLPSAIRKFKPLAPRYQTRDLPQRQTVRDLTPNGTVVFDSQGNWLYKEGNIRRNIIVYVPVGSKLEIDSRYAEIILDSNITEVNARIINGGLTMKDAGKLVLNSAYGSIYAANIGQAEVGLNQGWFHAKDISTLDINSRGSTVELGALGQANMISNADQYEMEEGGMISGEKNYGSLMVISLKNSLDLKGVNADIKVYNIQPGVSLVKIDDQYADLRLPVDKLKDYTVSFEGSGSNVFTPFERVHATDSSFKVKAGTGKKHSFQLKCSNCTVDMK